MMGLSRVRDPNTNRQDVPENLRGASSYGLISPSDSTVIFSEIRANIESVSFVSGEYGWGVLEKALKDTKERYASYYKNLLSRFPEMNKMSAKEIYFFLKSVSMAQMDGSLPMSVDKIDRSNPSQEKIIQGILSSLSN